MITAIFLRETLEAANNDAELMVQEGLRRKATYIHKLESTWAGTGREHVRRLRAVRSSLLLTNSLFAAALA